MARVKSFINENYRVVQNPFPSLGIAQWGSSDERENGQLFNVRVAPKEYKEAIEKFIVGPIDSGSKFHFLWSLGEGEEARGFGKTVLLRHIAREINRDLGAATLRDFEFDEAELATTAVLAAMATFNRTDVTSFAAVCLDHVRHLAQVDPLSGKSALNVIRERLIQQLEGRGDLDGSADPDEEADAIRQSVQEADLALLGKTFGPADPTFLDAFARADWRGLQSRVREADARSGFELLSSSFIMARAAGVRRVFLFIDQVEDFANSDVPKKRLSMEVERLRDLAVEAQPFGEMASYVLTMHPAAARSIEHFWSLARLPGIDHLAKQSQRITVILKPLRGVDEAERLILSYLGRFRVSPDPDSLHPFDRSTLAVLRDHSGGRPGLMLKLAHDLIEEGARNQLTCISETEARQILEDQVPADDGARRARRRGIGAIR
jgi:hypothetical protein